MHKAKPKSSWNSIKATRKKDQIKDLSRRVRSAYSILSITNQVLILRKVSEDDGSRRQIQSHIQLLSQQVSDPNLALKQAPKPASGAQSDQASMCTSYNLQTLDRSISPSLFPSPSLYAERYFKPFLRDTVFLLALSIFGVLPKGPKTQLYLIPEMRKSETKWYSGGFVSNLYVGFLVGLF